MQTSRDIANATGSSNLFNQGDNVAPETQAFASSNRTQRVTDAFAALPSNMPTKAPPLIVEQRDWLAWLEVRGSTLDRWGTGGAGTTVPGASVLNGNQVNVLAGVTRRLLPNFLAGVLGGYETFDYRSEALQGKLKGDGWTVGSYLGWMLTQNVRFDTSFTYSRIGYDGVAGTASGSFGGHRWLLSSGFTGSYSASGVVIEPSVRVYALWERQNAYTDSLGTTQGAREFSTGRASTGVKFAYPMAMTASAQIAPYIGAYGDYYFNKDDAAAAFVAPGVAATSILDGWSARATGGVAARFNGGAQIAIGGERSGLGGNFAVWTLRASGSVPFSAR